MNLTRHQGKVVKLSNQFEKLFVPKSIHRVGPGSLEAAKSYCDEGQPGSRYSGQDKYPPCDLNPVAVILQPLFHQYISQRCGQQGGDE